MSEVCTYRCRSCNQDIEIFHDDPPQTIVCDCNAEAKLVMK